MTYVVKDLLDALFQDTTRLMESLANKNGGQFTSQQFIKALVQQPTKQRLYVELLYRCLASDGNPSPFNAAHQHLGWKLSEMAQKAGYDGPHDEGRIETDIFGNPTGRIVYRKK